MPITITGVTGLGGSPPTSLLVSGTVATCESVVVTTSCSANPVKVAIPTGGPNTWNAVLPNDKQCPCGATVEVTATCEVGKKDSAKGTFTIVCDALGLLLRQPRRRLRLRHVRHVAVEGRPRRDGAADEHAAHVREVRLRHAADARRAEARAPEQRAVRPRSRRRAGGIARRPHPRDRVREGRPRARGSRGQLQVGHGQEGRDRRNHLRDHERRPLPPGALPGTGRRSASTRGSSPAGCAASWSRP